MKRPNIFNYATSELSQDALICWILSWSNPDAISLDKSLHELSRRLLQAFFAKHEKEFPTIEEFKIERQYKNIDILAIINKKIAIPIEDKRNSREHSDQLTRYMQILLNDEYSIENCLPIYLQTGEQGDFKKIMDAGFKPFLRAELLNVLKSNANIKNNILSDYIEYLEEVEKQVQSFNYLKQAEWGKDEWGGYPGQGFFTYLQNKVGAGEWNYVSNPIGGFLGFWWHFAGDDECEQYLQLEENKLCFKIYVEDETKRAGLRSKWSERIINASKNSSLKLLKPILRNGHTMTVAVAERDYRQFDSDGKINLEKTLIEIRKAEEIIDEARNSP